jgi:hypothetical protein
MKKTKITKGKYNIYIRKMSEELDIPKPEEIPEENLPEENVPEVPEEPPKKKGRPRKQIPEVPEVPEKKKGRPRKVQDPEEKRPRKIQEENSRKIPEEKKPREPERESEIQDFVRNLYLMSNPRLIQQEQKKRRWASFNMG